MTTRTETETTSIYPVEVDAAMHYIPTYRHPRGLVHFENPDVAIAPVWKVRSFANPSGTVWKVQYIQAYTAKEAVAFASGTEPTRGKDTFKCAETWITVWMPCPCSTADCGHSDDPNGFYFSEKYSD